MKPALDGIGTASGVAWPLFGILSSTLSLCIGGTVALILGSICSSVFLLICIPIAYISYCDSKKQQEELRRKKEKYENSLLTSLTAFFSLLDKYKTLNTTLTLSELLEKKAQELEQESTNEDKLCTNFLRYLNSEAVYNLYNPLEPKLFNRALQKYINQFLLNQLNQTPYTDKENTKISVAAFQAFVGAFGTIAGGFAGFTGLLMGLGLMASFSVVPWIGIAIVVIAPIIAIYMTDMAVRNAELNADKSFWCKQTKNLNQCTQKLNTELREVINLNQTVNNHLPASHSTFTANHPEAAVVLEKKSIIPDQISTHKKSRNEKENKNLSHQRKDSTYNTNYSTHQNSFFTSDKLNGESTPLSHEVVTLA